MSNYWHFIRLSMSSMLIITTSRFALRSTAREKLEHEKLITFNPRKSFNCHIRSRSRLLQTSDTSKYANNGRSPISCSHRWFWWWFSLWSCLSSYQRSSMTPRLRRRWKISSYRRWENFQTWVRCSQDSWAVELNKLHRDKLNLQQVAVNEFETRNVIITIKCAISPLNYLNWRVKE